MRHILLQNFRFGALIEQFGEFNMRYELSTVIHLNINEKKKAYEIDKWMYYIKVEGAVVHKKRTCYDVSTFL